MNHLIWGKPVITLFSIMAVMGLANAEEQKAHIDPTTGKLAEKPLVNKSASKSAAAPIQEETRSQHTLSDGTVILTGESFMSNIHASIDDEGKVHITHNTPQPPPAELSE